MRVVESVAVGTGGCVAAEAMLIEVLNNSRVRQRMITLERQQVVASARQDLFGGRGLAAHRIQRHDAVLQGELVQQRRNGGDLVRLTIDAALAQHQALLTGPGAHQVQWRLLASMVERASQRLAINGDHLALKAGHERAGPGGEAGLKGVGVDEHEHPPERVVRGNAVRQRQERPEPGQLTAAIQRDVAPAFSTGNHRTHRNHQDVEQAMPDLTGAARVLDRTQILRQVFDRHALFLRRREGTSSRVSTRQASEISCVAPANGMPYLSTATWILTPRIFLPPSMPRSKQLGAERQDRLSITTALGSEASSQARRQVRRSRSSKRRQRPSRVQRANSP